MITAQKWQQLKEWMTQLGIKDNDLNEKFIIGSGSGGQNLQKTSSCAQLQHIPTGIIIKCQDTRSREDNRYFARLRLCEKIEFLLEKEKSQKQEAIEKIRRQKRKRSRRAKEKLLADKHHQSTIKKNRQKPKSLNGE